MKLLAVFCLAAAGMVRAALTPPVVFPLPQEIQLTATPFVITADTRILVPTAASAHDLLLARELAAELSDRFGAAVPIERADKIPAGGHVIVMGSTDNALVRALCANRGVSVDPQQPGPEGYVLQVDNTGVLVAGSDEAGAFYGLQSLRQLAVAAAGKVELRGATVRDWPYKPFRGIKLYLPGRDQIPFFKRFVRDFMALYKCNELILELNASMRLDRHPELNAGWIDFARDLTTTRRDRPAGPRGEGMDSSHYDTADGGVLEKSEVAELVQWARQYHIDVIPELPSLTHSYYLLTRHPELAEVPGAEWPDAYCPSNPKSYDLLFDVLDEYIEVMQPKMIHVGHDEWRITVGACPRCRGRDGRELFAEDLRRIHDHLAQKHVATMIWGDHLIEELRGKEVYPMTSSTGWKYHRPGGLTEEQVKAWVPKDILIANWFWSDGQPGQGEQNEIKLEQWGFHQFFGNFEPEIQHWDRRSARPSVIGGAPSSWAATTEFNFGKDQVYRFLGCENLLWSKHWPAEAEVATAVQAMMPDIRERLSGHRAYSRLGEPQIVVNADPLNAGTAVRVAVGPSVAGQSAPASVPGQTGETQPEAEDLHASREIPIGRDASSLIFVHACEKRARNASAYRIIYDFDDTADLLGYYRVRYEDGFVTTVPVRYAVNILEQAWTPAHPTACCYLADPVEAADGRTYFAYEWTNPRLGKSIQSVSFHATTAFNNAYGQPLVNNAVLLKEIRVVLPRTVKVAAKVKNDDTE